MLFPSSPTESLIVERLSEGPERARNLVSFAVRMLGITPEAAYLALRNLKKKRIAVVTKGIASLYVFWIQDLLTFSGRTETRYRPQYPNLIALRDVFHPSFRSRTFPCPTFDSLENTFHHIAQSIMRPQEKPAPYFFFGFAPWWMTLCPEDADAFVRTLISYNYVPLMIFGNRFSLDKNTVARLKKSGCQIVFTDMDHLPFGFEGHYADGLCLEALHPMKQYPSFFKEYSRAKTGEERRLEAIMRTFTNGRVRLSRRKNPFSKALLDQFAVPISFFKR